MFDIVEAPGESSFTVRYEHLPSPPSEEEKYSYLGVHRRWPFVWLFASQSLLIYAYVRVMAHSLNSSIGLILLTFTVPPTVVNFWLRLRRRRVSLEDHVVRVETWRRQTSEYPAVDVFLPVCGEDPAVLANTFRHVRNLDWPGPLTISVLDDADDAQTEQLARSYGLHYVVRPNRGEWKKAGNLIHAFDHTGGAFIAVFDADFCPRSDFLFDTIPYMDEATTGVVQTAQYFDVDHRVNYFARYAGALQEMFFRWIQPARDTYEAAICAGTNVVYRRAAVLAAGGFAQVPLGEDVHSGVKIWVANFHTRYLPLVLAKGLAPDSWHSLTNQQYRWCRSSMLLMRSQFFRAAPFNFRQRMCFWAAFLYYMSSAAVLVTSSLPTLLILWFHPDEIHPHNYLLMVPSLLATVFIFPLLARGWGPTMYRVATINSCCHALAVFDAVRNQVQAWVPTGAVAAHKSKRAGVPLRIARIARVWFVTVQGLLWGGLAHALLSGHYNSWSFWPAMALGILQFGMLAPVLVRLEPPVVAMRREAAPSEELPYLASEPAT